MQVPSSLNLLNNMAGNQGSNPETQLESGWIASDWILIPKRSGCLTLERGALSRDWKRVSAWAAYSGTATITVALNQNNSTEVRAVVLNLHYCNCDLSLTISAQVGHYTVK